MVSVQSGAVLSPVTGKHDVYFVFNNDNAIKDKIVMHVFEIEFKKGMENATVLKK